MHQLGCGRWSEKITYRSNVPDVKISRTAYVADMLIADIPKPSYFIWFVTSVHQLMACESDAWSK